VVIHTREDPRKVPTRFPPAARPSSFWGMEHLWGQEQPSDPHNPGHDRQGGEISDLARSAGELMRIKASTNRSRF
jgi:hypothetical protein